MAGILPSNGVPPGSTQGGITNPQLAAGCENLYYPPRCAPRLDPFAMNALISEVVNLLNRLGRAYDCNQNDNLADAFLSLAGGQMTYNISGGTANARTLSLPPIFSSLGLVAGMEVVFRSHATNTDEMTMNVDGLGARPIVSASGNPMEPGDISTGDMVPLIYDGTNWVAYSRVSVVVPPAPPSLGVGQVWQDVTAQRAVGTTYQNNTGKPIAVSVYSQDSDGAGRFFEVSANGSNWVEIGTGWWSSGSQEHMTLSAGGPFIIPPSHFYRLRGLAAITLYRWTELR
jgi:hypothetical protein